MLSCKEVAARASALIDGELGPWESLQMRFHLAMCRGCARFIEQMRTTRDLTARTIVAPAAHATSVDQQRMAAILSKLDGR